MFSRRGAFTDIEANIGNICPAGRVRGIRLINNNIIPPKTIKSHTGREKPKRLPADGHRWNKLLLLLFA